MLDDVAVNVAAALYEFFSRFDIPVFLENNIPEKMTDGNGGIVSTEPPYITYQLVVPEPLGKSILNARVWYHSTSVSSVLSKCGEIQRAIGRGITIPTGHGTIALFPDDKTPFVQIQPINDPNLKVAYLTMILLVNTR